MGTERIIIFDTTLRDGDQSPGSCMTVEDKVKIAHQLKTLQVDVIEAGFPIVSDHEFNAVKQIADEVKDVTICALARALDKDIHAAGRALCNAEMKRIHIFLPASDIHLQCKLKKSREEALELAVKAVKLAKLYTGDIEFSAEDSTRSSKKFLAQIFEKVINAGATTVNIADTVGYATPDEFAGLLLYIKGNVKNIDQVVLSIHCHNDLGMATANSLSAVQSGARQIECTINGIGERAGNCALEEVVMAIKTRGDMYNYDINVRTNELCRTSKMVSIAAGMVVQSNKAIVGKNAFKHGAGIHQHGILQNRKTYEIMVPTDVGFEDSEFFIGKHSGHHALRDWLRRNGISKNDPEVEDLLKKIKCLSDEKKHHEVSDSIIHALIEDQKQER